MPWAAKPGWAAAAREMLAGRNSCWAKEDKEGRGFKRKVLSSKHIQTTNSNQSSNSNTTRRCTSMNETVNSYTSLIN
jgi:hypothetical protein